MAKCSWNDQPPESIHRPLGIPHTYPVDALSRLAGFYRGSNLLIGGKNHVASLTLHDTDCTAGSGPQRARLRFDVATMLPPDQWQIIVLGGRAEVMISAAGLTALTKLIDRETGP